MYLLESVKNGVVEIPKCTICLDDIEDGSTSNSRTVRVLPCKHSFHSECIEEFFVRSCDVQTVRGFKDRTCPNCRAIVPRESDARIAQAIEDPVEFIQGQQRLGEPDPILNTLNTDREIEFEPLIGVPSTVRWVGHTVQLTSVMGMTGTAWNAPHVRVSNLAERRRRLNEFFANTPQSEPNMYDVELPHDNPFVDEPQAPLNPLDHVINYDDRHEPERSAGFLHAAPNGDMDFRFSTIPSHFTTTDRFRQMAARLLSSTLDPLDGQFARFPEQIAVVQSYVQQVFGRQIEQDLNVDAIFPPGWRESLYEPGPEVASDDNFDITELYSDNANDSDSRTED